ncbi:hypothetical protein NO995_12440 [Aestuariibaculum sp. M13]|uniref:hypothetical protein n=1 Tax=Aestuariibaculum sp. M13 TaxID=2967132 RepID=UPI002159F086|nr:hypothetical protein [Aestuariibaculum sp. M13]MCR8668494.1 hypothetical protein [Aestuariibaculum sp. M13]
MELKDIILLSLGLAGWVWGIIQFILKRKYQKSDIAVEKRFEVYSNFMNQIDEMSAEIRTNPNMIYGIRNELMSELLTGDEIKINNALIKFNSELIEMTKISLKPMMIINQELNKLKLVASKKLLPKINEYKQLVTDFSNEYQLILNKISNSNDIKKTAEELKTIGKTERDARMSELWTEIESMMREEIDYYKK